jgi:hypothetical protein
LRTSFSASKYISSTSDADTSGVGSTLIGSPSIFGAFPVRLPLRHHLNVDRDRHLVRPRRSVQNSENAIAPDNGRSGDVVLVNEKMLTAWAGNLTDM